MGAFKAWVKRILGGTVIRDVLLKAKYYLMREEGRAGELSRSVRRSLRIAYRKTVLRVLPRSMAYQWVPSKIRKQE